MESRLDILYRDSYEAVKLLNSRLVALGHERCSSLHLSHTSEERVMVARDKSDLVENQGDATRDHTGSFAGADLTEKPIKFPETVPGHP